MNIQDHFTFNLMLRVLVKNVALAGMFLGLQWQIGKHFSAQN